MPDSFLGNIKLAENASQDSATHIIFWHARNVDCREVLARVALLSKFDCLVAKHLRVHVGLLKRQHCSLFFILAILGDLLGLEFELQNFLIGGVFFLDETRLLQSFLDMSLILLKFELEFDIFNLAFLVFFLDVDCDIMLHLDLSLFLHDVAFSALEFLGCFLLLHLDLVNVELLFFSRFSFLLSNLEAILALDLIDLFFDLHLVERGLLSHGLSVVGLQVLEQRLRADGHIGDLDGLQPDAPALDHVKHLLVNGISQQLAVRDHLFDGRVGDAAAHHG